MRVLVSSCSRTEEAPETLLVVDLETSLVEPIAMPTPSFGTFGICVTSSTIYVVSDLGRSVEQEPEWSELLAIDPVTLRLRWRYPFGVGRDVHSILAREDRIYAVSTGTDELLQLDLDSNGRVRSERLAWRGDIDAERADRNHLNAVGVIAGRMLVVGFGPRPGPNAWRAARNGFVRSVENGELVLGPLYHPHSICNLGPGEFAVSESARRRVVTSTGRTSSTLPGYARGLCVAADKLYVGTSRNRHPAEPISILPYDALLNTDVGVAGVCELDVATLTVQRVIQLHPHAREVYDIALLCR